MTFTIAIVIILLFLLTAILGITLISYVLLNKNTPKGLAIIHAGFAATALVLLIIYAFFRAPTPIESIVLFVIAALLGFILFYKDLTKRKPPKVLAIIHGCTAILGFVFLLANVFFNF